MANEAQETQWLTNALQQGDDASAKTLLHAVLTEPQALSIIQNANNNLGPDARESVQVKTDGAVYIQDSYSPQATLVGYTAQNQGADTTYRGDGPTGPDQTAWVNNDQTQKQIYRSANGGLEDENHNPVNEYGQPLDARGQVIVTQDTSGQLVDGDGYPVDAYGKPLPVDTTQSSRTYDNPDATTETEIYKDAQGNLVDRTGRPVDAYGRLITQPFNGDTYVDPGNGQTPVVGDLGDNGTQWQDTQPAPVYPPEYRGPTYSQQGNPAAAIAGMFDLFAGIALNNRRGFDGDRDWDRGRPWPRSDSYDQGNGYGWRQSNGWQREPRDFDYGRHQRHGINLFNMFGGF